MQFDILNVEHGTEEFCHELLKIIVIHLAELESLIPDDLSHISGRAARVSLQPEEVVHDSDEWYVLHYSYSWSIYNGCADMDEQGEEEDSLSFYVDGDGWLIFSKPEYPDYRNREFE